VGKVPPFLMKARWYLVGLKRPRSVKIRPGNVRGLPLGGNGMGSKVEGRIARLERVVADRKRLARASIARLLAAARHRHRAKATAALPSTLLTGSERAINLRARLARSEDVPAGPPHWPSDRCDSVPTVSYSGR
jgi:hypothetical protein